MRGSRLPPSNSEIVEIPKPVCRATASSVNFKLERTSRSRSLRDMTSDLG